MHCPANCLQGSGGDARPLLNIQRDLDINRLVCMHQCGIGLNKWKRDAAFVHWRTHGCILNSRRTIKLDINFHTYLNKSATQAAFFCLNPDWVWQSSNWAWKLTRPAFSVLFNVWTRPEPDTVDVSSCSEFVLPWLLLACLHWYHMSLIWNYYLFSSKGLDVNRSQPIPWKSSLHFFCPKPARRCRVPSGSGPCSDFIQPSRNITS